MVKVKCILNYYDTKLNKSVPIGEELEVTDDRAKQLVKAKVAEITTTPKEVAKKPRAKKEA